MRFVKEDESVPVHQGATQHPLVVFGDHRFCAGERLDVRRMSAPHMHSQVEINFVLDGQITYWLDGRRLVITAGQLCLFWGMVPHQVTEVTDGAKFVCVYVPMSVVMNFRGTSTFRDAVFRGAMIEALNIRGFEREVFLRWREELLTGDPEAEQIVREEMSARIRRIAREGWHDLRAQSSALVSLHREADRLPNIEKMLRFIAEHALGKISVQDVAKAAGLHPNYAMSVFKRTVGMTVNQAIMRHRLDTAQSLLIAGDLPVVAVAFEAGFGSLSRFYVAFEQRFGVTPAKFRSNLGVY
jgi:AraC-like DNA-binding protein/mannose-6-phosphate isomerase-like protein (cupin superfamily)